MDVIQEWVAREQIRDLAFRYALAVDAKDIDTLATLFVEDVQNGRWGDGREGVKTYYDNVLRRFHCTMHLVANHVVDFDDDSHARGIMYCRAHHHVPDPDHWLDKALAYWDTYERVDGRWLFRRRRVKSWYTQEFGHPTHGTERVETEPGAARLPDAFDTFDEFWARAPRPTPGRTA
jgi:hypothetical protein